MNLKINIENNRINIFLRDKDKILDRIAFPEERNLSEKLLPSIDKLLKKNKLEPRQIEKMELKADMDDSFTTFRIAKSMADSFNWSRKIR